MRYVYFFSMVSSLTFRSSFFGTQLFRGRFVFHMFQIFVYEKSADNPERGDKELNCVFTRCNKTGDEVKIKCNNFKTFSARIPLTKHQISNHELHKFRQYNESYERGSRYQSYDR